MGVLNLQVDKRLPEYKPRRRSLEMPPGLLNGLPGAAGTGGFAAAKISRLTLDFLAQSRSADQDLFGDNRALRARARKLALDNPHARKFIAMCDQNIVGSSGIQMQSRVTDKSDKPIDRVNKRIEQEWQRWAQKGRFGPGGGFGYRCEASGRLSWLAVQHLAIKNIAREGENLVHDVYGKQFNECGYALQLLDNDQLDDLFMLSTQNGGEIRLGVEVDQFRRPLKYWLYNGHPNDPLSKRAAERFPVAAAEITHTAIWERPGQTRGYTWLAASILSLNQYGRYEESVVTAARGAASAFGTIETEMPEGYLPEDEDGQGGSGNQDGSQTLPLSAGEFVRLDPGEKLNYTDPKFPTSTHKDFTQTMLRNIASGMLVSYPFLANDLEGVNFSSIRAGLVDERDCWRLLQRWFVEFFCEPIRRKWLKMALLTVLTDITLTPDQMEQVSWRARGFEWVDPLKDADAAILKRANGLTTLTRQLADQGLDFEETVDEIAFEDAYLKKKNVQIGTDVSGDQGGKGVAAGDESEAAEASGGGSEGGGKPGGKGK